MWQTITKLQTVKSKAYSVQVRPDIYGCAHMMQLAVCCFSFILQQVYVLQCLCQIAHELVAAFLDVVVAAVELSEVEAGALKGVVTGVQSVSKGRQPQDTANTVQVCEHVNNPLQ